jgi:hypothetical protein
MLGNRAPGAHLPGVQAEDHLGRLPPGQLPAGGYQRRAPRLRFLAVSRPRGWLIWPDATLPEHVGWQRRRGYARAQARPERSGRSALVAPRARYAGPFWHLRLAASLQPRNAKDSAVLHGDGPCA